MWCYDDCSWMDVHVNLFKETRQSKQLCPKTTPFFLERKNELPRAEFEPTTFCVLGMTCSWMDVVGWMYMQLTYRESHHPVHHLTARYRIHVYCF